MKKKRIKYKNILLILLFICTGVLIYNIIVIFNWNNDRKKITKEIKEIDDLIQIKEIEDSDEIELINPPEDISNDYWDYIKLPLLDIDFSLLKSTNSDTIGFLSVSGTNINYPVVQTKDNDFYLNHSFKKVNNSAGWVFMDYRNNSKDFDKNTVIYGHGRIDTTMFGTLKNILKQSWINDKNNYTIRYSNENENMLFQVFAVYTIPVESYYIKTNFKTDDEYKKWLNIMIGRSEYNFNTTVNEKDKILTLSTCTTDSLKRIVMHAKLIKRERKIVSVN